MPYSRSQQKREARSKMWPDLRYSPTGEEKLFYNADDVPADWTTKPPKGIAVRPTEILDRDELVAELTARNITIDPTWGNGHMKRIIDGDVSPTG